jgi:hypothetical protein
MSYLRTHITRGSPPGEPGSFLHVQTTRDHHSGGRLCNGQLLPVRFKTAGILGSTSDEVSFLTDGALPSVIAFGRPEPCRLGLRPCPAGRPY